MELRKDKRILHLPCQGKSTKQEKGKQSKLVGKVFGHPLDSLTLSASQRLRVSLFKIG
jgi:hypothetical protein